LLSYTQPGLQRRAERGDLVAGGEHRDAQAPHHAHRLDAERCDQSEMCRPQQLPRSDRRTAQRQVLAALAQVLAGLDHAGLDAHALAIGLTQLERHDGVGTRRHHGTGHDAHAVPRAHRAAERRARHHRGDGAQLERRIGAQRGAGERIAVHRRVVVRGHVDRRDHVLGQHPAERLRDRHRLARVDRLQARRDRRARLLDAEVVLARGQRGGAELLGHGR